ncbi:ImmA/IrrE family metallo-endopeptidase [Sinomonas sp. JGH33]|uniref:ImmA/IrrE family metallo-endopeptidase n=1 Tax=Sinomonas terricola TaxID=3110330 RepID=A0ABU5T590_9MICC|nr:ImmA/IrrE family metallo-endopeptidase [Sinomonas sp. JGH33]MEA5454828.1 ImmA/IrrE family metallo-endopeptidase [Sinomonas sp. JGH33]
MFSPWGALRELTHVTLHFVVMPDGAAGRTDGVARIWLDKRLQQAERRCALTHELVHLEHGHTRCQGPRVERRVRAEAARRLIRFEHLEDAYRWTQHPAELADELWVTSGVVLDRLEALTDEERARLAVVAGQT